jgi:hypothetical protein
MYAANQELTPHLTVFTEDQFGARTLEVVGARVLLVPTQKLVGDRERLGIQVAGRHGRGLDRPRFARHSAQPPGDGVRVVLDPGRRRGRRQRFLRRAGLLAGGPAACAREQRQCNDKRSHAVGTRRCPHRFRAREGAGRSTEVTGVGLLHRTCR